MKIIAVEEHLGESGFNQVEERLEDMDEAGIDMQVLSAPSHEHLSVSEAVSWAKSTNDAISKIVEKYPKRFSSFASIPFPYPQESAKELERSVKELGFKGTMIGREINGEYLDMDKYWVLFEMAEKLDVPIYVHPTDPSPDMIKPYLAYPILSRSMWGYAAQAGLHAMRLICGGIFDKFPKLKIILGHLGENIPFQLWRLDNRWSAEKDGFQTPNGWLAADPFASKLKKKPSQYFRDNFHVTTSGMFWHPALQLVLSAIGPDRILFAVDYPQESNKVAVQFIKSAPITDIEKGKICHLNAETLLGL